MPPYPTHLSTPELVLWLLEFVLIFLLIRKPRLIREEAEVSKLAVAFVLVLAWNWRLIYEFALGSSGFWFFVEDDVARFLMSHGWSQHPYFMTWDGIWQGGTFYVHGAAMRLISDPVAASKLVSAVYNLLPLLGIFVFSEGLFRNRRLSLAVVLFSAPLWLHLLLSTGTLAEMPTAGFILTGAGFLLLSAYPETRHRNRWQLFAAISFACATAFHVTAWMMLVPIILIWLGWAIREQKRDRTSLKRWFLFAAISGSYAAAWLIDNWITFGNPLHMFHNYAQMVIRDAGGVYSLRVRVLAYPSAIAYTVWGIFPLVVFGVLYAWFHTTEQRNRIRWTLVAAASYFCILEYSALRSNPNPHAYRSTLVLATMLIPFAVAPLWALVEDTLWIRGRYRWTAAALLPAVLLVPFSVLWVWDNHQRTLRERRELDPMDANAIAVGAWLRQEIIRPQLLEFGPASPPIRVWAPSPPNFRDINIAYAAGFPARVQLFQSDDGPGYSSMQPGQYLITPMQLSDPRLEHKLDFGNYKVYRFRAGY